MKLLHAAILALTLPVSLAAQQPSAGPPANPITAVFRGRTMSLQRNLAQAFDSIPGSMFGYRPTPAQLSIGYIAQHLASDNYLFCNNFGAMKAALSAKYMPVIEDGVKNLQKAMDIDPESDDAMAYMNLLIRERADLADDKESYKKQVDEADSWLQKALDTKKAKQEKAEKKTAGGIIQDK